MNTGPFLIMIAASLWALDGLLRTNLSGAIPSAWIVMIEHAVGFVILLPLFWRAREKFKTLTGRDWLVLIALTIVSSVAGTILFTEALARSFATYDYATPLLLLKLQPIFVILLAVIFLKEKLTAKFVALVPVALFGSYLISFGWHAIPLTFTNKEIVVLLSLGATFAWGAGTILSKTILKKLSFSEATSMRFLLAIPVAYIAAQILGQSYSFAHLTGGQFWRFVIIGFTTGAAGVLIYYRGLQKTEAKVSTIAELIFPIISILIAITPLNPYGEAQVLSMANVAGIVILLASVLIISIDYAKKRALPETTEIDA